MKEKGLRLIRQVSFGLVMVFAITLCHAGVTDIIDDIASSIKGANTKELTKHFSSTVSMSLLNDEGVYSKVQAEIILRDFLNRNTPTAVKFLNRMDSNPNFKYVVLSLTTSRENYRVSYKLIQEDNVYRVTEFRIEKSF